MFLFGLFCVCGFILFCENCDEKSQRNVHKMVSSEKTYPRINVHGFLAGQRCRRPAADQRSESGAIIDINIRRKADAFSLVFDSSHGRSL